MLKRLKNTDMDIFPIVLGTDYYGSAVSEETAFSNLDAYVENGGNIVDTARMYADGKSEETIGKYIKERKLKNKLLISTKAAYPFDGDVQKHRLTLGEIEGDVDKSLSALGTERIDILWLHRDLPSVPAWQISDDLAQIVKKGKVRFWGVSNWRSERIKELNKYAAENGNPPIVSSQIQWSLAKPSCVYDPTLVTMGKTEYKFYSGEKMPVFAFASQAKGFFEKYASGVSGGKAMERYLNEDNVKMYERLVKISRESGFSLTALSLAYLTGGEDFQTFPIIGCSKTEYVGKALEALKVPDEVRREIYESL